MKRRASHPCFHLFSTRYLALLELECYAMQRWEVRSGREEEEKVE